MKTQKTAYCYSRWSTKRQRGGDSHRRQKRDARRWAKENNYSLIFIEDDGISAYRGKNRTIGRFADFVQKAESGQLGDEVTLVLENFDRMSREELHKALGLFQRLIAANVTIVTLHNEKVYRAPLQMIDCIIAVVEMDLAWQYSQMLSRRIRSDWEDRRALASKGQCIHRGTCPSWLEQRGNVFHPIPDRVRLVREIFNRTLDGEGTQKIAVSFNRRKVPTWSGRPEAGWHANFIKRILRSRSLLGEFQPCTEKAGKVVKAGPAVAGYFPRVIDEKLFCAVQEVLRVAVKRGPRTDDHWNLVAGLAYSGKDGSVMWGQKGVRLGTNPEGTRPHYLKSRLSVLGLTQPCHFIRYTSFEEALVTLLKHIDEGAFARSDSTLDDEIERAEDELAARTRQVEKYRRIIANDDDPSPTLVLDLKNAEKAREGAKMHLMRAQERKASRAAPSAIRPGDLLTPESRAKLRAEIARHFPRIDIFDGHAICWFEYQRDGIHVTWGGSAPTFSTLRPEDFNTKMPAA